MRQIWLAALAVVLAAGGMSRAETIKGEYLEARNADVWTGPCFANSEMGIVGNKAILAWKVTDGVFQDVRLDGLSVAAVVIGDQTFGIGEKVHTRTVLLVDERANETQRSALVAMANQLAKGVIQNVVAVKAEKISLQTGRCEGLGCATLEAGAAKIQTRCLCARDKICGHETIAYPSLATANELRAAYSLTNEYTGKEFGETFRDSNARSAMLGHFAL